MERYSRNLGSIGIDGQEKLNNSKVAIIGLGGLGGYVLETLARIGVGNIVGIDNDIFVESNLNRQILATQSTLGQKKTYVALKRILEINPLVDFKGINCRFEEVDKNVLKSCDLIFDCLDTLSARKKLAETCKEIEVAIIHGAIAGWCGQVGVVPKESSFLENMCLKREKGIEKDLGNLPFTAAFAANLMTAKAVLILLKKEEIKQSLTFFDLQNNDFENLF